MSKTKAYVYFISYLHKDGGGNIDVTLDAPIQSIEAIRGVEQAITNELDLDDSVTVLTYQQLESS